MAVQSDSASCAWPILPLQAWQPTYATLHMWAQMVGKVRLRQAPLLNHWWQVPLQVTARGLSTAATPHGQRAFDIHFDFIDHRLVVHASGGASKSLPLSSRPVAQFYEDFMYLLRSMDLGVRIWPVPVEVPDPIPFDQDMVHAEYDPDHAQRFWQILVQSQRVFEQFRACFIGKSSPVHFFWGSFDLALTRFSGRRAPAHPGAPNVARSVVLEAYSHEVSSCGFWPGGGPVPEPVYYAYAYPEPDGFQAYPLRVPQAYYHPGLREFLLPYEAVRTAKDPDGMLLDFLHGSYQAAAECGRWDRANLER